MCIMENSYLLEVWLREDLEVCVEGPVDKEDSSAGQCQEHAA